ncbi:MAG: hypothetical protein ACM34H_07320 [Deltaproteobacteria bacterium]
MIAKTISYTGEFEISQPAPLVFPLFTPEGERLWAPGWVYENLMGTNTLCEDYLFLTRSHDHAAKEAIWIVKKYEPEVYRVQYYKIEPGEKVGIIEVGCHPSAHASTKVRVSYRYIGLSENGNRFVEGFTREDWAAFIGEWKSLIDSYFAEKLHPSAQPGR